MAVDGTGMVENAPEGAAVSLGKRGNDQRQERGSVQQARSKASRNGEAREARSGNAPAGYGEGSMPNHPGWQEENSREPARTTGRVSSRRAESSEQVARFESGESGLGMAIGSPGSEQTTAIVSGEMTLFVQNGVPLSSAPQTSVNGATNIEGGSGVVACSAKPPEPPRGRDLGEPMAFFSETSGTTWRPTKNGATSVPPDWLLSAVNNLQASTSGLWRAFGAQGDAYIGKMQILTEFDEACAREVRALHVGHQDAQARIGELDFACSDLWNRTATSVTALEASCYNTATTLGHVERGVATARGEVQELWLVLQGALGEVSASMTRSGIDHAKLLTKMDTQDGRMQRLEQAYDASDATARSGSAYIEKLLTMAGAQAVVIQQLQAKADDTSRVAAGNCTDYIDMVGKVEKQGETITLLQTQFLDASGVITELGGKMRALEDELRRKKTGVKVVNSLAQQKATSRAKMVNVLAQQLSVLTQWMQGSNAPVQGGMPAQAAAVTQAKSSRTTTRISKIRRKTSSTRSRATRTAKNGLKMYTYTKPHQATLTPAGRTHAYNWGASSTMTGAAPATTSPAEGAMNSPAFDRDLPGDRTTFNTPAPPANATPEQEASTCAKSGGRACPVILTNLGPQAQIAVSPSLANLDNLFQRTLSTAGWYLAKGPGHVTQAIFSKTLLTRMLAGVRKNIGDLEKCAWWRAEYQADFVYQDLTHEMDSTMYNLGNDTVTKAVLRKAVATIFSRLGVERAPSLAAVPEEPEAPNSESEDAKCPASEDGKDGAGDSAPTAGVKATTPVNECAEVNVETKTINALLTQDTNAVSGKKELGGADKVPNFTSPGVKTETAAKEGAGVNVETKAPAPDMKGASPKVTTADPAPGKHAEPEEQLEDFEPVLKKGEYIIKIPKDGNCLFGAAATGMEANLGHARPVGKALRLALANDCRAKTVNQVKGVMRAHFEDAIKERALFVDGFGKEITNIDDHATEMGKQGIHGGNTELVAIAEGNRLRVDIIRGETRYSILPERQKICNPPITLAYYGDHYDLVVDTQTEMGRRMADADRAESPWPSLPRLTVDKAKASKKTPSLRDMCKGANCNAFAGLEDESEDQPEDGKGVEDGRKTPDQGRQGKDTVVELLSARMDALDLVVVVSAQHAEEVATLMQEAAAHAVNHTAQRLESELLCARAHGTCNRAIKKCREALASIGLTPYLNIADPAVERALDLPSSPTVSEAAPRINAILQELLPPDPPWAERQVNVDELLHLHQAFADGHRLMESCVPDHGMEARVLRHPLEVGTDRAEASLGLLRSRFAATLSKVERILSGEADGFQPVPVRKGKTKKQSSIELWKEVEPLLEVMWDTHRSEGGELYNLVHGTRKGARADGGKGAHQTPAGKQLKAFTPHGNGK